MTTTPPTTATAFLEQSATFLRDDYLPRIRRAVAALPPYDLWWRPNDASNSVGNLLLHLAGNLRQWVVSGVGGEPDVRRRDEEFEARGPDQAAAGPPSTAGEGAAKAPRDAADLLERLTEVVEAAASAIEGLDPARLQEPVTIQGGQTTVMDAIYHAVEHFSMHTGQILWIAKARTGRDLGLYRKGPDGHPRRAW